MVTDFQHGTHLCYPKSSFRTMFHCGRTERAGPGDTTIDEWYGNKQTQNPGDNNKQTNKQTNTKKAAFKSPFAYVARRSM